MTKKWNLWIMIVILIFLQGCGEIPRFTSEDTIVPPRNKQIPIKGLWQIRDFKSLENTDFIDPNDKDWVGETAAFSEGWAVLGNERCSDAQYKIRSVNAKEYFLFHYNIDSEELKVTDPKVDIVSVVSQDKPFYDFVKLEEDQMVVYAHGGFYTLIKISDTVDNAYVDNNSKLEEKKGEEGKEPELLRSGIFLGLRSVAHSSNEGQEYDVRSTYRTLWISSHNRKLGPILEVSDLFVPRRSGFWRVGIKTQKINEYIQDLLFAYPVEQEFYSRGIQLNEVEQEGNVTKNILFVGDDYIALEYSEPTQLRREEPDKFKVLPLDDVNSMQGIRISDIADEGRKNIFFKSAEAHLVSHGMKIPGKLNEISQEDNFTLVRRNGHWILRGRLNYDNDHEDFTIGLSPINKLINYDELHISWDAIKEKIPAAVDAYTSPNKDLLLVITSNFIDIYTIKDGVISSNPLRRINIRKGETVIMAEWATAEYVARWEKSFSQLNPFILND